jgi:AhpD family alkylhydroperoxidase
MSNAPRFYLPQVAPDTYRALAAVETAIRGSRLEKPLIELVKMRASQINGCAFCLNMHSKDARKNGETEQRLYVLPAWRETTLYTEREQAALAWTEHLTRVSTEGAPQAAYDRLAEVFEPDEVADLTVLIGMINLWNRVSIGSAAHPA